MNRVLVLDQFNKLDKKEQKNVLDRLETKIEYTEMAYNETKSEVMKEQLHKLMYYFNIGYAFYKGKIK